MNNKGFTFVELLAVLVVLMLVASLISDDYIQGVKYWVTLGKLSEMQQYLRYAMKTISDNLRNATQVNKYEDFTAIEIINEVAFEASSNYQLQIITPDSTYLYNITNDDELMQNSNSLGGPFEEVTIRRISSCASGALYEVYIFSKELTFETVPALELRQFVFAPNITP